MSDQKYASNDNQIDNSDLPPYHGLDIDKVVSIDFGSYGFASSFCQVDAPEYQRIVQNWSSEQASTELNKNLAALLIDKITLETIAIGYEAEEMYAKAIEKNNGDKYMYFQHFKPYLYSTDYLRKNIEVPSADGKSSLPLSVLITKSFESIMEHSIGYINQLHKLGAIPLISASKIFWVICVPAIWDEMSKELMKNCALKAGMIHFELGSEPVTSAFHVIYGHPNSKLQKSRNKFIVLDCGGGTIDASCIQVLGDHCISELHFSEGIRCGGLGVDDKFIKLLEEVLPPNLIKSIKDKQPGQWIRQRQEFVMAKFTLPLELDNAFWNVSLSFGINAWLQKIKKKRKTDKTYKNLQKTIKTYQIPNNVNNNINIISSPAVANSPSNNNNNKISGVFKLGNSNMKISRDGWLWLHNDVLTRIVLFVNKLFLDPSVSNCSNIILSGGFANSKYLINRLKTEFPSKTFHSPQQPHLAVAKGALYWVCKRKNLKKTRAKYSYGIAIDRRWTDKDDIDRQRIDNITGNTVIRNAFGVLVHRNWEYIEGHTELFDYYIPQNQNQIEIALYASEDEFCQYVFDLNGNLPTINGKKCFKVKEFVIPLNAKLKIKKKFQIKLEYKSSGINLYYTDPNDDKTERKVQVDTTTVKIN